MAWRLERESVNMPIHSCSEKAERAVCMATSSALMMVRVSSVPAASIYIVVEVGMCTTAAPSLGWPSMSEPSVYTQFSGIYFGFQGCGKGGASSLMGGRMLAVPVRGSLWTSVGSGWEDVYSSPSDAPVIGWSLEQPAESAWSG